jgi:hypothetical protein
MNGIGKSMSDWEETFTDFEAYVKMPAVGSKLYNWKLHQLISGSFGLDAKIWKEIEANEGGTV